MPLTPHFTNQFNIQDLVADYFNNRISEQQLLSTLQNHPGTQANAASLIASHNLNTYLNKIDWLLQGVCTISLMLIIRPFSYTSWSACNLAMAALTSLLLQPLLISNQQDMKIFAINQKHLNCLQLVTCGISSLHLGLYWLDKQQTNPLITVLAMLLWAANIIAIGHQAMKLGAFSAQYQAAKPSKPNPYQVGNILLPGSPKALPTPINNKAVSP